MLAAIQTMAVYYRYRVTAATWADRISGDKNKADYWRNIFEEHPEFFRRSSYVDNFTLALRRAMPRRYHTGDQEIVTDEEFEALSAAEKTKISRAPLQEGQIKILTDIALNLHAKALDSERDWRWWVAPAMSLAGSFLGALLAFAAAALFKGKV